MGERAQLLLKVENSSCACVRAPCTCSGLSWPFLHPARWLSHISRPLPPVPVGKGWDRQSLKLHNNEKVTPAAASLHFRGCTGSTFLVPHLGERDLNEVRNQHWRKGWNRKPNLQNVLQSWKTFQGFDGQGRESEGQRIWFTALVCAEKLSEFCWVCSKISIFLCQEEEGKQSSGLD